LITDTTKGIYLGIIAAVSIAIMGVFVKLIGTSQSNFTILFFRFIISLLILLPIMFKDKSFSFKIKFPYQLSVRMIFGFLAIALYFYAIQHIELVNAILLESSYPIFVPLVIYILTRNKTNKKVILGILISFIGIIIVLKPGSDIFQPVSVIALLAGVCASISYVFLKMMLFKDKTQMLNLLFYFFLFGSIVPIPFMIFDMKPIDTYQWFYLVGVGIFGYGYQYLMTKALQLASVRIISPLIYISVIAGGCFDWLIWSVTPSYFTLVGTIVTILGGVFVIINRNQVNT